MPPRLANFVFLVEMGFHHVGQVGLESPTLSDLPSLASKSAGIIGMSHHARPGMKSSSFLGLRYLARCLTQGRCSKNVDKSMDKDIDKTVKIVE